MLVPVGMFAFAITTLLVVLIFFDHGIHTAIWEGDVQKVEWVLNRSPSSLESKDKSGRTPLLHAARDGRTEIVDLLIRRGANVHACWDSPSSNDGRWTALHITAIQGQLESARLLLAHGAEVNALSLQGETPLDVAIQNRHKNLADLFRINSGKRGSELR
jgi:uncharacterized protein